MKNITQLYSDFCKSKNINFTLNDMVNPYDDTTLFCPAGMQQFKSKFKDINNIGSCANIQSCIRMNDFEEIGDTTHLLYFNMIGLFSFRELTLSNAVDFWVEFLSILDLKPDYCTIHPMVKDDPKWNTLYDKYNIPIKITDECYWTDGEIGGYCTEFFINDVEIGNIVNPLDTCIDVGFGLERLEIFCNNKVISKEETLKESIYKIIDSGYTPSNKKQGYVLRKLIRELYNMDGFIEHQYFNDEIDRQKNILQTYNRLKSKHKDKSNEWWYDTLGIKLEDLIKNDN
jgi:alanyl-tRNA synthetase